MWQSSRHGSSSSNVPMSIQDSYPRDALSLLQEEKQNNPAVHWEGNPWREFLCQQSSTSLHKKHKAILQQNYVAFVQYLKADQVMDYLVEDGIISSEQSQKIMSKASFQARNRELHDYIKKKGDMGYFSLMHAVVHANGNLTTKA